MPLPLCRRNHIPASKLFGQAARRVVARDTGMGAGMEAARAVLALSSAVRLQILAASKSRTRHQEIVEIHIIPYELPKCIVDGHLRYELLIIL